MAEMVANAMLQITQSEDAFRHIDLDTIKLPVTYLDSSRTLISQLRNMRQLPDYIISIGQGTPKITIETSGSAEGSDIADVRGHGRADAATNFPGLDNRVGFNFPVQDLYCGLDSKTRSRINVSYTPGNFVCNDISYNMSQFVRPSGEIDRMLNSYFNSAKYEAEGQIRGLKQAFEKDYPPEAARIQAAKNAELPALQQCDAQLQQVRAHNLELQRREAARRAADEQARRNEQNQNQNGVVIHRGDGTGGYDTDGGDDRRGGPVYSNISYSPNDRLPDGRDSRYGNSGTTYGGRQFGPGGPAPAQRPVYGPQADPQDQRNDEQSFYSNQQNDNDRYFPEPDCRSRVRDTAQEMKDAYERNVSSINANLDRTKRRLTDLHNLYGIDGQTRFAFFHVPVSDGIAYTPDYSIAGVQMIGGMDSLPYGWVEAGEAQRLLGHKNIRQTIAAGSEFMAAQARAEEARQREWEREQQRNAKRKPSSDDLPIYNPRAYRAQNLAPAVAPTPVPPRMVFSLSASQKKAVTRENNEAYQYAHTILEMFVAAIEMQKRNVPAEIPLPRFNNRNRFPLGREGRNSAKAYLTRVSNYQTIRTLIPNPDPKAKPEYSESTIPPQMDAGLANCYIDFLNKVGDDESAERRAGKTRF